MTDPTERLAEALVSILTEAPLGLGANSQQVAADLTAQGFGHREDHVRAFAEWARDNCDGKGPYEWPLRTLPDDADRYLASLKEEAR